MRKTALRLSTVALGTLLLAGAMEGQKAKTAKVVQFPAPPKAAAGVASLAGTWQGTYSSNKVPPTQVTLIFQQLEATVTGTYLSANGAQGVMSGTAQTGGAASLKATQVTPTCFGRFQMPVQVNGSSMTWKFTGQDCLGSENGSGTATKQ